MSYRDLLIAEINDRASKIRVAETNGRRGKTKEWIEEFRNIPNILDNSNMDENGYEFIYDEVIRYGLGPEVRFMTEMQIKRVRG